MIWSFSKKEILELYRSYKLLILGLLFIALGILNPLTAKLTPVLMKSLLPKAFQGLKIPNPTALDSWLQFFKNVPQLGLLGFVLVFSGILVNEISDQTLIILLTKGLKRTNILASKLMMMVLTWSFGYWLCALITYSYTIYYWPKKVPQLGLALFLVWLFGIFLTSLLLALNVLSTKSYHVLLGLVVIFVLLFLLNLVPDWQKFNPLQLLSVTRLLQNDQHLADFYWSSGVSLLLGAGLIVASGIIFNKKAL